MGPLPVAGLAEVIHEKLDQVDGDPLGVGLISHEGACQAIRPADDVEIALATSNLVLNACGNKEYASAHRKMEENNEKTMISAKRGDPMSLLAGHGRAASTCKIPRLRLCHASPHD